MTLKTRCPGKGCTRNSSSNSLCKCARVRTVVRNVWRNIPADPRGGTPLVTGTASYPWRQTIVFTMVIIQKARDTSFCQVNLRVCVSPPSPPVLLPLAFMASVSGQQ